MVDTTAIENDDTLTAKQKTLTIAAADLDDKTTADAMLADAKAEALTADMIAAELKKSYSSDTDADLLDAAIRWWIF
jgi:hypothetical protein